MTIQTRMPSLWALLVGSDADAEERAKAALIRAKRQEEDAIMDLYLSAIGEI